MVVCTVTLRITVAFSQEVEGTSCQATGRSAFWSDDAGRDPPLHDSSPLRRQLAEPLNCEEPED